MERSWIVLLLITTTGCSSLKLSEGIWFVHKYEVRDDGCNATENDEETLSSEPTAFNLQQHEAGFTLNPIESAQSIDCSLNNKDFKCTTFSEILEEDDGFTLMMHIETSGTFVSNQEIQLYSATTLNCEGESCSTFEQGFGNDLPCKFLGYTELILGD